MSGFRGVDQVASWRSSRGAVLALLLFRGVSAHAAAPDWAFPSCAPSDTQPAAVHTESLSGSDQHFSSALIGALASAIDWFPDRHEPMPAVVAEQRGPGQTACGYCHLPDGTGRPENAKLAGLPQTYILSQFDQMHSRERDSALRGYLPLALMRASIEGLSPEEKQAAAAYFARQMPRSFERVIEAEHVPAFAAGCFVRVRARGNAQLLGERIIEFADNPEGFELRDPRSTYTAYVPPGSLRRGEALASRGRESLAACSSCHGAELRGDAGLPGPPIAGRFAGYLARQLYGFKSGARQGAAAQPMQAVTALLSDRDVIDVVAYTASLDP